MTKTERPRLLILVVAYHAEATIVDVLGRIPEIEACAVEMLIIDDGSADRTFERSEQLRKSGSCRHPLTVLANPVNQGYGGNQKIGYHFAMERGFDLVALLHGDGQYAPESLPALLAPILGGEADVVLGSRLLRPLDALRGGMPLYKFVGNRILTWYQNRVLGTRLSEFHSGYRVYSVSALRRIPFELNSNVFHFDTEILIQFLRTRCRIAEVPIHTHYGGEVCRVNGIRYAIDVIRASTAARLQDFGLAYRANFDVDPPDAGNRQYESKVNFPSTHSAAIREVPPESVVMDIGCGPGHLCAALHAKGCRVVGIDRQPPAAPAAFDEFFAADLNDDGLPRSLHDVQTVLLLDIIEHLRSPEAFCKRLHRLAQSNPAVRIIVTTGNVGFAVTRLMLLFGQFNYNKRGILDLTHTRLFTLSSMRRLLTEAGFSVVKEIGIPAPVPLVVRSSFWRRALMGTQACLIRISRGWFAYQMLFVARPLPTLETLLAQSVRHAREKA